MATESGVHALPMKQQMLKERVELLAIGETLGYPRLGIGRANGKRLAIRAGQSEWEKFCGHAHTTRIPAALRIGRILRDNGVTPYNPKAEQAVTVTEVADRMLAMLPVKEPIGVIRLDDPTEEAQAMVVPKRSKNALRQARWRAKQKEKKPSPA